MRAVGEPVKGDEAAELPRDELGALRRCGLPDPRRRLRAPLEHEARRRRALAIDALPQQRLKQIAVRRTQRLHPE